MPSRILFSVQTLVVIGFAALLPLFVIPASWLGVEHAKVALAVIAVFAGAIAWGISVVKQGTVEIPRSLVIVGICALPIVYLLSALIAHPSMESFLGSGLERDTVVAVLLWASIALLGAFGISRAEGVRSAHMAIIGATLIAIIVQVIRLAWPTLLMGASGAASATLVGSWHDLISMTGLAIVLAAGYIATNTVRGAWRWALMGTIGLGFVIMIMASFRDIWIVLAVASLAVLAMTFRRGNSLAAVQPQTPPADAHDPVRVGGYPPQMQQLHQSSYAQPEAGAPVRRTPLMVVAAVSIVFAVFGGMIHQQLPNSLRILQFEVRPSWDGTMTVITSVWSEGKILFGSGPNTFANDWALYKPLEVNETPFWEVGFVQGVGVVPTSFATVGIIGGIAWIAFLALVVFCSIRVALRASGENRLVAVLAVVSALYIWALNVFYVPGVGVIALAFLSVGMLIATARITNVIGVLSVPVSIRSPQGIAMTAGVLVVFIAMFGASAGTARAALSDAILNRAIVDYQEHGNLALASSRVQKALDLYASDRSHRAAVELGLLQLREALATPNASEEEVKQIQGVLEQTIKHGLAAVVENEGDLQNWLTLARTYEELAGVQVQGAFEQAVAVYEKARDLHPTSPVPYFKLAQIAVAQNNIPVAQAMIDESLKRKQTYLPAHLLRSRIFASQNDAPSALASMQAVVQLAPNEPGAWYEFGALLFAAGDIQKAEVALRQAVTLEPSYANAWFVLARIYAGVGDRTRALEALEKVRALNPDNEAVLEAISQVRAMGESTATPASDTTDTTDATPSED